MDEVKIKIKETPEGFKSRDTPKFFVVKTLEQQLFSD